jgi:hypothetical protein
MSDKISGAQPAAGAWRWLVAVTAGTALFGALMVLAPALTRRGFSLLMHGQPGRIDSWPPEAVAYITLLHGVLGAVMVGWAVALLGVLRGPWRPAPRQGWGIVAASVGSWFVIDVSFSAALGAWPNVMLNLAFGVLFGAGLLARPALQGKAA